MQRRNYASVFESLHDLLPIAYMARQGVVKRHPVAVLDSKGGVVPLEEADHDLHAWYPFTAGPTP